MFDFINNFFKPMNSEPETTEVIDQIDNTHVSNEVDGWDETKYAAPLFDDQLELISSVLKEVVYLYTQTGAGFSSELQERIRQAQELLEH